MDLTNKEMKEIEEKCVRWYHTYNGEVTTRECFQKAILETNVKYNNRDKLINMAHKKPPKKPKKKTPKFKVSRSKKSK